MTTYHVLLSFLQVTMSEYASSSTMILLIGNRFHLLSTTQ